MPYKTEKIKINDPFLDRRTKLIPCQKEMVLYWYNLGTSIRAIARMFHVDKRLIQFVLFPERKEKNIADRLERGGSKQYYDKKKNTNYMRKHRKDKHERLK